MRIGHKLYSFSGGLMVYDHCGRLHHWELVTWVERTLVENFSTILDWIVTFASLLSGWGFSRNIFFQVKCFSHERFFFFFFACVFQVHLARRAPCVFLILLICVSDSWQLQFIPSEFRGQLPKPFAEGPLATRIVPTDMNDQNLEEPSRYVRALFPFYYFGKSSTLHICWHTY